MANKIKPKKLIILVLGMCLILLAIILILGKLNDTQKELPYVDFISIDSNCVKSHVRSLQGDTPISSEDKKNLCGKSSRLYIQPNQNSTKMKWAEAVSYCEKLKVNGYDDWYLPKFSDFATIQYAQNDKNNSLLYINTAIASTYSGKFEPFIDDYYWTNTKEKGFFHFDMARFAGAVIGGYEPESCYVRCIRQP